MTDAVKVLDKGFVRLDGVFGDDDTIVRAARVSYGKGTKTTREDEQLIDYLMRHRHTSPFEMVVFRFHLKLPIFVARQLIRHRTASVNEYSGRYSVMSNEYYIPEVSRVQGQNKTNKQGSDGELTEIVQNDFVHMLKGLANNSHLSYEDTLESGVARELARVMLPVNLYTEMYWQIDLHNLFHFLKLRSDKHAQWEIREYAREIGVFVGNHCPVAFKAWMNHSKNAVTLSRDELEIVRKTADVYMLKARLEQSDLRPSRQRELLEKLGLNDESL